MLNVKEFVSTKLPEGVSFQIPEITEGFVYKSLINLDPSKATGLDGIIAYMLNEFPALPPGIHILLRFTAGHLCVLSCATGYSLNYQLCYWPSTYVSVALPAIY